MAVPNTWKLPQPFRNDNFTLLRSGIYDDPGAQVYVNEDRDFAFLNPLEETDYAQYKPRVERLDLKDYKDRSGTMALRYEKVLAHLARADSLLEIGAGNASFLVYVHEMLPNLSAACVEPDSRTKPQRDKLSWLTQYQDFSAIGGDRFDVVCLFHVLEHVLDPLPFLQRCLTFLGKGGRLIIEVPSLDDPLVSLYDLPTYLDFFFQKQHPYYYSPSSLSRMIEALGNRVEEMIPHQRYGLENHLNWLRNGVPGGNEGLRMIFNETDGPYRKSLEDSGHADAVIAVVAH